MEARSIHTKFNGPTIRKIAFYASADPVTVKRYLEGTKKTRPQVKERIQNALKNLGIEDPNS